jgi:Ca2+-binding RTX toxin-like protein
MNERRKDDWRRATRRLLVAVVLSAAAILAVSPAAHAAVTASFLPAAGTLSVFGDAQSNSITISRNAAGNILVNGGAVAVTGGTATVANTALIQVFGQAGNDTLTFNEANGALPAAILFGGVNNDTLTGGSGNDLVFGQAGNDTLLGKGGNDQLFGGADNDVLTGGDGDDQVFGESGNDRMVWNPGDDTDLNEGGNDSDTVQVNGGNGTEQFTTTANGVRVRFDRLDPAPFSIDMGTDEKLVLNANGGDDGFSATGNLAALIGIAVDGGTGNDKILGSNGVDTLSGGDGDDFVDGQQGNDVAFLGAGDDTFQWDPGDGNDTVEGQDGTDKMLFNGANVGEKIDVSANGNRVRFTRDVANITMDLNDVEGIDFKALGGADTVTVNDVTGTDLTKVDTDLGAVGGVGDGVADNVIVNGTNGNDTIQLAGAGASASVVGLAAQVNIANAEGANDALVVKTLAGDDNVNAGALAAGVIKLTIDGATGNDALVGSQGADTVVGGDGDDLVLGGRGDDVVQMGAGNDTFQWNPGDANDTLEGQEGADSMLFFGANVSENIDVAANGARVRFSRNVANVVMDVGGIESIDFRALGGADNVVVGELTGTEVTAVGLDMRGPAGGGDGAEDTITVNGTQNADQLGAAGDAAGITISGLPRMVKILGQEQSNDRLTLNGLGGDDSLNAASLKADAIQLTLNGGLGADSLFGSEGNDLVIGADGNDVGLLGAGDDRFVWNPGDDNDTVEGQAGFDRMLFNGANVAEHIEVSANGSRIRFTRDVANIAMDLNDVEAINFNALGGADTIAVHDLSGTDLTELNTDIAASGGGGDAQPDSVIVDGTSADDVMLVAGDASGVAVLGLTARVNIVGAEAANDKLTANALAGDDVIEASGVAAGAIQLTLDGGDGDDVLIGGAGNDTLHGGAGDDVLIGGAGQDILDGGGGSDIVLQLVPSGDTSLVAGDNDAVDSADVADKDWIASHIQIVDGKTVIIVGGKAHTLQTDLSQLVQGLPTQ